MVGARHSFLLTYRQRFKSTHGCSPRREEKRRAEQMDQLDPGLVQRVNAKVSTVVERYLLDDQDVTPKNTRKAYDPKQAEWMVSSHQVATTPSPLLESLVD